MAGNTQPIFSQVADIQFSKGATAANTTTDLTSGTIYLAFTADATNGGYVQRIRLRPLGTNSNPTVARLWINNGAATSTGTNNCLFDEISIAASTSNNAASLSNYELPLNFALPPGYRLYVTLGTAAAAGFDISVIGGKY